jgi:hypothetical protein
MKRFKNILLVCNFDEKQYMAEDRAVSLAKQNEARLTVFTAMFSIELPAAWVTKRAFGRCSDAMERV